MSTISMRPAARRSPGSLALLRFLPHLLLFAAFIGLWETAGLLGLLNEFLVPRPSAVAASIGKLYIAERTIYRHFLVTLYEAVAGFAIGAAVGIGLAVASALNDGFRRYVAPYAVVLNVTPGLALTPIVIAWFGFGWSSKIALAAIISFFPVFVNTLAGLSHVDEDRLEMFRSLRATRVQTFMRLRLPAAVPVAFAGMKVGMTAALVGAIVAEFAQASEGVGVLMQRYSFALDMSAAIATLLSMSVMGLMLFSLMELLDDRVVFWRHDGRLAAKARRRARNWKRAEGGESEADRR